jgi:pimeloyl-ACP methyl ester carboxylesterase
MRRVLSWLGLVLLAAVALPPLWFALAPAPAAPGLPPAEKRVVLASGVGVNVVERGAGPPVVLVHGLPGTAYDWRALLDPLAARGRRALAYDRVGYGHSDARSDDRYSVEQNALELLGLLEALELSDATIAGWSYGGGTAIVAAQRDASRIGRLVLIGSTGPGIENHGPPPIVRLLFSGPVLAWMRAVPPLAQGLRRSISAAAFSDQPQPAWWLETVNANFARPHTALAWREEGRFAEAVPDPTGLELPVLVIHGEDDRLSPVDIGRELARRAPRAKLLVVPGGSHVLPITHADLLADEIAAFGGTR